MLAVDDSEHRARIRGIALSWNCVAAAGENYFEVDALRGPTVVEGATWVGALSFRAAGGAVVEAIVILRTLSRTLV